MAQVSCLVSFVRSLIENDNRDVQDQNKKKLEKEYYANGQSLNKNLADKYDQVSQILSVYRYILERVKCNRAGVAIIKENLTECKTLLQCNRDDLRRLWLELVEKRHCVKLLETLEEVRIAPELVTSLTEAKQWTKATLTVVSAQKKINNGLEKVSGVQPIRADLEVRQKTLIHRLKSEIHTLIFTDVLKNALKILSSFGERRISERSIGKKVEVISKKETIMESDPQFVVIPQPFASLSLSNWRNISMDKEFWSDEVESFDIKNASNSILTDGKFVFDEGKYPNYIISSIFSLHQLNKLQELLNEWSLDSQHIPHNLADDAHSEKDETFGFIRKELHKLIIIKSIEHIKRSALSQNDNRLENFEDCGYLLDLLELLYIALFQCQSALMLMERAISYLKMCKRTSLSVYQTEALQIYFDQTLIRKTVQNELKSLLNAHLTTPESGGLLNRSTKFDNDLSQPNPELLKHYLGKKKGLLNVNTNAMEQGKHSLFKFSNSSHALSVSACLQEMRPLTMSVDEVDKLSSDHRNMREQFAVVCKPSHNNIIAIYGSVMGFIETLEAEENYNVPIKDQRNSCILRIYIHDFIEKVFLKEFLREMDLKLNSTIRDQGAVKGLQNLVSQASERELGLQRPIIVVMLNADECLEEIKKITLALRHYSTQCLRNGLAVMEEFKDILWGWFRELSSLDTNRDPHMSTEWGKDADFIRYWKGLPSWQKMSNIDARENFHHTDYSDLNLSLNTDASRSSRTSGLFSQQLKILGGVITNDACHDNLLEEREARLLVNRESEHLLRLIKEELKSQSHSSTPNAELKQFTVFQKNDLIKQMARLHESVSWFVQRTVRFQTWLSSKAWLQTDSNNKGALSDKQLIELNKVIGDFSKLHDELNLLADACLLSIHLEGRLRAYNCVMRLSSEASYKSILDEVDVDPQVTEFVKSLSELELSLTHSLTRHKFRFVFEGLGNFVSALMVQILSRIKVMTTSGIKKMCCNIHLIQQTLSVLTQTHEMDLVRVKQLYELLYMTPEVVVNRIMEQGAVYDEQVYRTILNLYQKSHSFYDNDKLQEALTKLSEVINMEYV